MSITQDVQPWLIVYLATLFIVASSFSAANATFFLTWVWSLFCLFSL